MNCRFCGFDSYGTCPTTYDCSSGGSPVTWVLEKQQWCCSNLHIGCPYECRLDAGWSWGKRAWCCRHEDLGCSQAQKLFNTISRALGAQQAGRFLSLVVCLASCFIVVSAVFLARKRKTALGCRSARLASRSVPSSVAASAYDHMPNPCNQLDGDRCTLQSDSVSCLLFSHVFANGLQSRFLGRSQHAAHEREAQDGLLAGEEFVAGI